MSIAAARSGQNAEIERREWGGQNKRVEGRIEREVKSSFEFSQKEHRSKLQ